MATCTPEEFVDLLRASRSYRRFDESRPVTRDELLALVGAARLAPSGNNMQLLRFRLVDDPAEVAYCASCHGWAALLKDWDGPAPGERPTAYIAVCAPQDLATNVLRNIDAGIAAQTIMLAARSMGLGGCMVKSFSPVLNDRLGLGEKGLTCVLLLALGRPAETVVLEGSQGSTSYWRDEQDVHHVPKLSVDELLA